MKTPYQPTTNATTAVACFRRRVASADEMLGQLKTYLASHLAGASKDVTWEDAANVGHLVAQLTEACQFLTIPTASPVQTYLHRSLDGTACRVTIPQE